MLIPQDEHGVRTSLGATALEQCGTEIDIRTTGAPRCTLHTSALRATFHLPAAGATHRPI